MNDSPPAGDDIPADTGSIRPEYRNGSIVNLMGSLLKAFDGPDLGYAPTPGLPPEEIRQYRQVVLIVLDGLGQHLLDRLGTMTLLRRYWRCRLTSVFPSTTATAIPSFLSGQAPRQHGVTGWHMYLRELGAVLAILPGRPRYGGVSLGQAGVDIGHVLGHRPIFDRLEARSLVVAPRRIARSDFNLACLGSAGLDEYDNIADFFGSIARALTNNHHRRFIYAYWPELDRIAHETGSLGPATARHLRDWDLALGHFLDQAAGTDTLVLITADHGFIDCDRQHVVDLTEHPELEACLSLPLCGEPRAAYAYVKPHCTGAFEGYVSGRLHGCMDLHRSDDLIAKGWFGPGTSHPRLRDRIGDYTLVLKERYVIHDRLAGEKPFHQRGVHGGTSPDEMWVPLSVIGA